MEKNFFRTAAGQKFLPSELRILPPLFLGMRKVERKEGGEIASKGLCELGASVAKFLPFTALFFSKTCKLAHLLVAKLVYPSAQTYRTPLMASHMRRRRRQQHLLRNFSKTSLLLLILRTTTEIPGFRSTLLPSFPRENRVRKIPMTFRQRWKVC